MTDKKHPMKKAVPILRYLPLAAMILIAAVYILLKRGLPLESLLRYWQGRWLAAALILLLLYAVKSVSVFLPLAVLYVASGSVFPPWAAVPLNLLGIAVAVSIPYGIGHFSGAPLAAKLTGKYPGLGRAAERQRQNPWFISFFLRAITFIPGDVVSLCLGSLQIPFGKYLAGSIVGLLPMLLSWTLLGASITEPDSWQFWVSLGLLAVVLAGSVLAYCRYRRRFRSGKSPFDKRAEEL